jgi:hypothetical protein
MKNFIANALFLLLAGVLMVNCTPQDQHEVKKYKMTTETPEGIATPDVLNSSMLGDLNFFDGIPYPETAEKIYDFIDLNNAVNAYVNGIQIASMEAMKQGILEHGPANTTALLFENLMDSRALWLTPNTTSI